MAKKQAFKIEWWMWVIIGFIAGFITAYFIFGRKPDAQTISNATLSKVNTDLATSKDVKTNTKVSGASRIDTKPDGTASYFGANLTFENHSEENNQLRLKVASLEQELTVKKTVTYTAGLGIGVDPFCLSKISGIGEISLLGPIYLGNISSINFKTGEFSTTIFTLYRF